MSVFWGINPACFPVKQNLYIIRHPHPLTDFGLDSSRGGDHFNVTLEFKDPTVKNNEAIAFFHFLYRNQEKLSPERNEFY